MYYLVRGTLRFISCSVQLVAIFTLEPVILVCRLQMASVKAVMVRLATAPPWN